MDGEGVREFSALEEVEPADFVLVFLLAEPHVLDAEPCARSLVVGAVDETLYFVIGLHLVGQLVGLLLEADLVEADFLSLLVRPQPLEHRLPGVFRLGVALLALELFEVERAGGLEPDLDFFVVFSKSLLGFLHLLLLLLLLGGALLLLGLLLLGLLLLGFLLVLGVGLLLCEGRRGNHSAPLEGTPDLLGLGQGCQCGEPAGQVGGLG